jgi:2,4-dienoyl-CoA reductase-like NADH-dependent reductase (Old Yellow Enzyme family)
VFTDSEIDELIEDFVRAAEVAAEVGADFVDIKHCHGYLLHEFLSARSRPGKYGGSFDNRTRILREIVSRIHSRKIKIDVAVRLSAFDFVPFKPDPARSTPGKPGPGIPEAHEVPYRFAFGVDEACPVEPDLREAIQFAALCVELGVKILNVTAGSPYYNPHIQRPAAYPPSDGYQPPEDPISGVVRQIQATRQIREALDAGRTGSDGAPILLVGSAYSYLQEYLPHVAQAVVRQRWTDIVGIGRAILSYPNMLADATSTGALQSKSICRTFSDCTTAPRNGMVSGCYPLDRHYSGRPEAQRLKELKRS